VAEGAKGEPIWDVMEAYFKNHPTIAPRKLNTPKLVGMAGNPGMAG
jgi:sulfur-oxidizing protein SoxB